jgi:hypothetical protein
VKQREAVHVPGDALLHPLALVAIGLLVVNDHLLKSVAPGPLTGKLSDFAGLVFFPLFVVGAWEVVLNVLGRWERPTGRALGVGIVATAIAFVLVKTTPVGAATFSWVLGALQWVPAAGWSAVTSGPPPWLGPAAVVADPSDLVALVALLLAFAIGARRIGTMRFRQVERSTA